MKGYTPTTTPKIVVERLKKLLQKLSLPKAITVDTIKDSIWNAQKSSGSSELFFLLTEHEKDQATIDETMRLMQDAWNYFPHRVLGGKSPHDLMMEYQQTGKIDQNKHIRLPKKGKSLPDIFANQYPKTVVFEKISEDTWGWGFPTLHHILTDDLWEMEEADVSPQVFEKELYRMIKLMPELFDAVNDLARVYGKRREFNLAKTLYEQTIKKARAYIPNTFTAGKDRVLWAYVANRPFLRMLAGYAMLVEQCESIEKAIPLYEEIISFNHNDNQGIRALLATAYLKTNQPEKVIELASLYANDITPDLVMGKLLALLQRNELTEAKKHLNNNKEYQTHIIKELLKTSHPKPATLMEDRVRVGGEDEAFYYWQSQGKLWEQTEGALAFLQDRTKDIQVNIISLTDKEVLAVDIFHDFLALLNLLKERPIKRTATGNISLKDIDTLLQTLKTVQPILKHTKEMGWQIRREDEILPLHLIKTMADIMHLTYKKHDKLFLSKNGRTFLDKLMPSDQFTQLFQYYRQRLNWAYYASFTEKHEAFAHLLQTQQDHIWRRLTEKGTAWIEYKMFCEALRDDLRLQTLLEESYTTPEEILYRRIDTHIFSRILSLFGCVETETKQIDKWDTEIIRFRLTKIGIALLQQQ